MTKKRHVTQQSFEQIHKLLGLGVNCRQISSFVGKGYSTVGRVKSVKTFEEYKEKMRNYFESRKAVKNVVYHSPEPEPTVKDAVAQIRGIMSSVEKYLTYIEKKAI